VRHIKTFILRLYIDPDVPERLCGDVRSLEEPGNYPFKDLMEFDKLLHSLSRNCPYQKKGHPARTRVRHRD
jgi:hypothetical protein